MTREKQVRLTCQGLQVRFCGNSSEAAHGLWVCGCFHTTAGRVGEEAQARPAHWWPVREGG